MKRSEMIRLIVLTLDEEFPVSMSKHDELAEKILRTIEEVGMQPPSFRDKDGDTTYYIDGDVRWADE